MSATKGKRDIFSDIRNYIGVVLCCFLTCFVIYVIVIGQFAAIVQRSIFLMCCVIAVYCFKPFNRRWEKGNSIALKWLGRLLDVFFSGILIYAITYILQNYSVIASMREGMPNRADLVCYSLGTLAILEAVRRTHGLVLLSVILVMFVYLFLGHNLPGILNHQPLSFSDIIEMSFSLNGIFGVALATVTNTIAIFIIMGSVLLLTGMGDLFTDLSLMCTGRFIGGPAQASIIAATLYGSVNGSGPACVMSVGSFTIPLMIRSGYTPTYAGALCATASCVGQIMPPVMGVGAFLMAEITGIPYSRIVVFAIVPALLYSISLMLNARFEALRLGLFPLKKDQCSKFEWKLFPRIILLVVAISVLLWQILAGYAVNMAGFRTIIVLLIGSLLIKEIRPDFKKFVQMFINGGRDLLSLTVICAAIGILIGGLGITGLGFRFSQAIIIMAKSNLLLALALTAVCCIILGMGLPTAASYLIVVFVALPPLLKLGFPVLDTHMFVFYYAVLSAITPPVALNAYAAASIAKDSPFKIGFLAVRIGVVGFILPFLWITNPALIIGNAPIVITVSEFLISIILIMFLSAASSGYLYQKLNILERISLGIAAIILIFIPYKIIHIGGPVLLCLFILLYKKITTKMASFSG